MNRSPTIAKRFWARVQKTETCWLWTGQMHESGYGLLRVATGVAMGRAHRISWELHRGAIPAGIYVCHRCDVRRCVRPDHLFLGTASDNIRDCAAKGRMGAQRNPSLVRGEHAPGAKLSADQVAAFRRRVAAGERPTCVG